MRYFIKTRQKMLFDQIFGQKTFFGQRFDDLSRYPGKAIFLPFRFFQKTGRVSSNLRKMNNKTITQKSPKTSES